MTNMDDAYTAARFAQLPDDELMDVVGKHREDYEGRAIDLAWIELRRRGIDSADVSTAQGPTPTARATRSQAPLGVRWLGIYAALLGAAATGGVGVQAVLGPSWRGLMVQLPVSALQGAVAYGLLKRRLWGWYLNWAFLALLLVPLVWVRHGARALALLLLIVVNAIYFARPRHLFGSAAS